MSNYESMKKWAHICYLIEKATCGEKIKIYRKYYLLQNLERFAFDMYLAAAARIFREPYNFNPVLRWRAGTPPKRCEASREAKKEV